jgi:hypothetical protein
MKSRNSIFALSGRVRLVRSLSAVTAGYRKYSSVMSSWKNSERLFQADVSFKSPMDTAFCASLGRREGGTA